MLVQKIEITDVVQRYKLSYLQLETTEGLLWHLFLFSYFLLFHVFGFSR